MRSKKHMRMKRWLSLMMAIVLTLTTVLPASLPVMALSPGETGSQRSALAPDSDDLGALLGNYVTETDEGFDMQKRTKLNAENVEVNDNNFAGFSKSAEVFSYEADILFRDGEFATLIFGATNPGLNVGKNVLHCFELRRKSNGDMVTRLFQMGGINKIIDVTNAGKNPDPTVPVHFKIEVDANKDVRCWVDGTEISLAYLSGAQQQFKDSYHGGYFGFLTFGTNAVFSNVKMVDKSGETPMPEEDQGVEGLGKLQGKYFSGTAQSGYELQKTLKDQETGMKDNNFAGFSGQAEAFTFETSILFKEGPRATLMFGAPSAGENIGTGKPYCFEMSRNEPAKTVTIRMFQLGGANGGKMVSPVVAGRDIDFSKPVVFKIEVALDHTLSAWVNGEKIALTYEPDMEEAFRTGYTGGYLGLMTNITCAVFSDIHFAVVEAPPEEDAGVPGLGKLSGDHMSGTAQSGYLMEKLTKTNATTGALQLDNNFAGFSEGKALAFAYEADIQFMEGNTATLMAGATNPGATIGKNKYLGIELSRTNPVDGKSSLSIKGFQPRGVSGNVFLHKNVLTDVDTTKPIHFKVQIDTMKRISVWINGASIPIEQADAFADYYEGGYLGLMTFGTKALFTNIQYVNNDPNEEDIEKLSALEVTGLNLVPAFNPMITTYYTQAPSDLTDVQVKAVSNGKITVSAKFLDLITSAEMGASLGKTEVASGEASPNISLSQAYKTLIRIDVTTQESYIRTYYVNVIRRMNPEDARNQKYRPQYHYTPERGYMNDPNGLVYNEATGEYHMFFQYGYDKIIGAPPGWGHAVSKDMVHWEELPPVLYPDELGSIFSGSCVIDRDNTSGLFDASTPPGGRMVAIYTSHGESEFGTEKQSIAYSTDNGRTFTKYKNNPVLKNEGNKYSADFRDPKVNWYPDASLPGGGEWIMVVAGKQAKLFSSPNLIDWTFNCDLMYEGQPVLSECPDIFQITVENTGEKKWAYMGAGKYLILGGLVRGKDGLLDFVAEPGSKIDRLNGNRDLYATQSYYNDPQGRRVIVSWVQDRTATVTDGQIGGEMAGQDKIWNGAQSIPYALKIYQNDDGSYRHTTFPVEELGSLRKEALLFEAADKEITPDTGNLLSGLTGTTYEIEATFTLGTATEFGFRLREGKAADGSDQRILISYQVPQKRFFMDKSQTGKFAEGSNPTKTNYVAMEPLPGNRVKMRILVDNTLIDTFGNDGAAAIGAFLFPDDGSTGMSLFATGGSVTLDSLKIYDMSSIWYDSYTPPVEKFKTNLENLKAVGTAPMEEVDGGLLFGDAGQGNLYAVSDTTVTDFVYEADLTRTDGTGALALLFGNRSNTTNSGFIAVNIDGNASKLFGTGVTEQVVKDGIEKNKDSYHVKLEMKAKHLKAYIDDVLIHDVTIDSYAGGYLGLMSWKAQGIFQNVLYEETAPAEKFNTNLVNLKAVGDIVFEKVDGGLKMGKAGNGNFYAMSGTSVTDFVYEADVSFVQGDGALSLVFGSTMNTAAKDAYAVNVIGGKHSKIFGPGINKQVSDCLTPGKDSYHLRLEVTSGHLKGYVDDKLIHDLDLPSYAGGYLGLLSWNAIGLYQNVLFEDTYVPVDNFKTNLEGWGGDVTGDWLRMEEGYRGMGSGNCPTFATTTASDFTYTAHMEMKSGGSGAAILFRRSEDKSVYYAADVGLTGDGTRVRILKFTKNPDGSYSDRALGSTYMHPDKNKRSFDLKVQAIGPAIYYYIDGELAVTANDAQSLSGAFGLNTCNMTIVFQDVEYTPLDAADLARLTDLAVEGVELIPAFDPEITAYSATVPYETESIALTPVTALPGDITVNGQAIASGDKVTLPLTVGSNSIRIEVRDEKTDIPSITTLNITRKENPEIAYTENYRLQYHYSPASDWVNDPNGMVYYEGEYHLFYQHSPGSGSKRGPMHWGHAVSTDLVNWTELPVALAPDDFGDIYSGSAVVDKNNTSGLFSGNRDENGSLKEEGLVAVYTYNGKLGQVQAIAYSADRGRTWTKYEKNPVIGREQDPLNNAAFRDPKVFWHEESGQWMMIVAGGPVRFFSSPDLIHWKAEGTREEIVTECPDLFELPVEGGSGTKWVLSRAGRFYMVGDFQKVDGVWNFVPDNPEDNDVKPVVNFAPDSYAGQTYDNTPDGRRIMISWMSNWGWGLDIGKELTTNFNGGFTLHEELFLKQTGEGVKLYQRPAEEYKSLREVDKRTELAHVLLTPDGKNPLKSFSGNQYEIIAEFTPEADTTAVGFRLRTGEDAGTLVQYDLTKGELNIDRRESGKNPNAKFPSVYRQKMSRTADGKIRMRIFVDWSSVEVFGNDGEVAGTAQIFPHLSSTGAEVFTTGGNARADITIYPLRSIWRAQAVETEPVRVDLDTIDTQVTVGDTVTVGAKVIPLAASQAVGFTVSGEGDLVEVLRRDDHTLVFKALKTGTVTLTARARGGDVLTQGTIEIADPNFQTNLQNFTASANSDWVIGTDGLTGTFMTGDAFYIAKQTVGPKFNAEVEMQVLEGTGAGLVFGSASESNGKKPGSYVFNIDTTNAGTKGVISSKLFKFEIDKPVVDLSKKGDIPASADGVYHLKVEADNGRFKAYINGALIHDAADNDRPYLSGYVGLNCFRSVTLYNNLFVTTDADISSVVTKDLVVYTARTSDGAAGSADVLQKLPAAVTVMQTDKLQREAGVTWDTASINFAKEGDYAVTGAVDGTTTKAKAKVTVVNTSPVTAIHPDAVELSVETGATQAATRKKLPTSVAFTREDGSSGNAQILYWDLSAVDFDTAGTYPIVGTLDDPAKGLTSGGITEIRGSITVQAPLPTVALEPEKLERTVKPGTDRNEIIAGFPDAVIAVKSDGSKVTASIIGWDFSAVDLTKEGTYTAVGQLEMNAGLRTRDVNITKIDAVIHVSSKLPTVLSMLELSEGALVPQFSADVTEYAVTVAYETEKVQLKPTYTGDAAVTVNGTEVASGEYSADIALDVGENKIEVVAGEKTYTIKVTREAPAPVPTVLTDLALSTGTLAPNFSTEVTEYTATVANSVDSIKVLPTYTGDAAVTVNGTEVASGEYSTDISLNVGENTITVVAGEKTYTIKVTREDKEPPVTETPFLDGLELSQGVLQPSFNKDVNAYTASVGNATDSIQVKPFYSGEMAVTVNGKAVESGVFSEAIALDVGENTIEVKLVMGEKDNIYTIVVTRAKPADTTKPITTKPSIPGGNGSEWKWPEGTAKPGTGKENPQSGDASALPIALLLMAGAAGTAVFLSRKRKK
ncbi:GH32 C-terminal domain-containing protein [Zongyangia hominis]|uniref:GH32 C-terminal domain-containing protein n=1 Tax=Zongyangia hominis TaxID=2763677 RepID=A0A926IBB8_9FIRM|nr:GH32 C-terminal domain-containing protein [Zongyangia hominis]MBC8571081.1 GH32 C-terminal domain-containing protein [Zongyangia hominis]